MTLHLIEMPLALQALHRWAAVRLSRGAYDEGLALHHLLGESFGPAALQPFRLMVAPRARQGSIYAYATQDASTLAATASATLTPDLAGVVDLSRLRSLPRPANWAVGQRLGFDLRYRPVVRLNTALDAQNVAGQSIHLKKGAEVDAFLVRALRDQASSRDETYLKWLADRLAPAASLDLATSRLASFQRSHIHRNGRRIEGPDATVHGTLTVLDPGAFSDLLAKGVGRHRSYGYGMLLLRPPQRERRC